MPERRDPRDRLRQVRCPVVGVIRSSLSVRALRSQRNAQGSVEVRSIRSAVGFSFHARERPSPCSQRVRQRLRGSRVTVPHELVIGRGQRRRDFPCTRNDVPSPRRLSVVPPLDALPIVHAWTHPVAADARTTRDDAKGFNACHLAPRACRLTASRCTCVACAAAGISALRRSRITRSAVRVGQTYPTWIASRCKQPSGCRVQQLSVPIPTAPSSKLGYTHDASDEVVTSVTTTAGRGPSGSSSTELGAA
jgi:hypothetical protein